jgi:hypothetical protein
MTDQVQERQIAEDVRRGSAWIALIAEWDEDAVDAALSAMSPVELRVLAVDLACRYVAERAEVLRRERLVDEPGARRMVRDEERRYCVKIAADLAAMEE